jgi:cell division protein FtsB
MTELAREIFQAVGDRFKNRVFGPYIISFLFWNWKPILMVLASKNTIESTIYNIENQELLNWCNVLVVPFGISIFYSIGAPYLNNFLDYLTNYSVEKKIISKFEIKGKEIDQETLIASKIRNLQNAKAGNLEVADLNSKNEALQKSNEQYIKENDELRKKVSDLTYESSDRGLFELQNAKQASDHAVEKLNETFFEIVDSLLNLVNSQLQKGDFQLSKVPASIVEILMDHGFIESQSINSRSYYKFTQAGRNRHFA